MAGYSVTYSVVDNASKQIEAINRRVAAMRAPMERLSKQVSRFVDVSGLNTIAKGFSSIGRAALGVLRTLTEIVPVLGTLTGAATIAGMVKLVGTYADWSQKLVSTADNLGTTTQQLQQFEDAARLAGGKTEDMDAALKSLYQAQGNFMVGKGGDATLWANHLGIAFKDATGHARTMADLMPEVVRKVSEIKDPYDRAAAATALLGDRGNELVNTFRRSHQSFGQWMTDASKYTELSDKQKDQLQAFSEAQGHIATSFDHLGQQISATLAKNFTPLLNTLAEFVDKHQGEIIAAVDNISNEFRNWISGIDWDQVKEDVKGITEVLKDMLKVAEAIGKAIEKTMFLFGLTNRKFTKEDVLQNSPWYSNLTADQQKQVRQEVGITEQQNTANEQPQPGVSFTEHPMDWLSNRVFRGGQGNEGYQRNGPDPLEALRQRALRGPASIQQAAPPLGLTPPAAGQAPSELPQLPGDTSWGDYGTRANNPGNMNYARWQNAAGRFSYMDQTEGRQHTMAVYNTMEEGVSDAYKLMLQKQEQHGKTIAGALSAWSTTPGYAEKIAGIAGLDPNAPLDLSKADPATVERLMQAQFKMEGRRGSHSATEAQILGGVALARGDVPTQLAAAAPLPVPPVPPIPPPAAPAAPAQPAAPPAQVAQAAAPDASVPQPRPASGTVDVNITGKNMPPNTAITASATGPGVNVAPPRVERQELASI